MFSSQDIDRIIASPREHEHLEFKKAEQQFDTEKLYRYCVALANEGGGELILGVTDKLPRKIAGTKAFQDIDKTKAQIFSKLNFRVDVEEVQHPEGRVLIFRIPSRPSGTAFSYDGAYLMRVGENLVPMSEDRLRRIFDEGKINFLLRPAVMKASEEDIIHLLDTQSCFDLMKMPYPATREAVLQRFEKEQFIVRERDGWQITNLGAILFAKSIDAFTSLRRKAPRVIVYKGIDKLDTVRDQLGGKGYALGFEGLIEYIIGQLPANEIIGQALRTAIHMYPVAAIRELVANALVHQDVEDMSSFILIEIYSDRMEITNPGKALIQPDRFIDEYKSRNELLTDIMRRLHICEEKSSGIDRVVTLAESWQLPAPDIRVTEEHTKVILFSHKPFSNMDRQDRVRACYQHACLRYVNNQKMTNQSLRERFKLPDSRSETASRIIADTLVENLIKVDNPENQAKKYIRYVPYWG